MRLEIKNIVGITDYLDAYRNLEAVLRPPLKNLRVALLSSFSMNGFKEVLAVQCAHENIRADIYVGGYNQFSLEMADDKSGLNTFGPQLTILYVDAQSLFGDMVFDPLALPMDGRKTLVNNRFEEFVSIINRFKNRSLSKILVHSLKFSLPSPLGILDEKTPFGVSNSVGYFNRRLKETFETDRQVFVFDTERFASEVGLDRMEDPKMYYVGDFRVNLPCFPALASSYLPYIKPLVGLTKKCLVLDLDNTLWGGVLGEEGPDGIRLGPSPDGRVFWELQKYILGLWRRGILLAVNSKNNREDALDAIKNHPHMVLRENHFASIQINWNDKATNLITIARELSIGLDSVVYMDDDPMNRDFVRLQLPEVEVVDLPRDNAQFLHYLSNRDDFSSFSLTEEDLARGDMYGRQQAREQEKKSSLTVDDYLRNLDLVVALTPQPVKHVERLSQLTQKTNQFNLTSRRHTEEDLRRFLNDPCFWMVSMQVSDKFGDYGVTGLALVKKTDALWRIDSFLLSCRVIGRRVEEVLLNCIFDNAQKAGAREVIGEFIPSGKNDIVRNFFQNQGFLEIAGEEGPSLWSLDLEKPHVYPDFIKVKVAAP